MSSRTLNQAGPARCELLFDVLTSHIASTCNTSKPAAIQQAVPHGQTCLTLIWPTTLSQVTRNCEEYCPRQRLTVLVRPSTKPQSKSDNGDRYNSYLNLSSLSWFPLSLPYLYLLPALLSFHAAGYQSVGHSCRYVWQFDTNTISKYVIVLTGFKIAVTRWPSLDSLSPHRHKPPIINVKYNTKYIPNL